MQSFNDYYGNRNFIMKDLKMVTEILQNEKSMIYLVTMLF
jgi:hypothetical protein